MGDVDYQSVNEVASWVTPVPGGVGPMTVEMVVKNTLNCAKKTLTPTQVRPFSGAREGRRDRGGRDRGGRERRREG